MEMEILGLAAKLLTEYLSPINHAKRAVVPLFLYMRGMMFYIWMIAVFN